MINLYVIYNKICAIEELLLSILTIMFFIQILWINTLCETIVDSTLFHIFLIATHRSYNN